MKVNLQDDKGLTGVSFELDLVKIREELGSSSSTVAEPTETEAQLKESQGKVEGLEGKVAELGEKLATAEARTMSDFAPMEKANFVIDFAKDLSMEDKAIFCEGVGIPIAKVTEAEVAEAAAKAAAEAEPSVIVGKTDRPGYKYLEYMNMSVKE